MKVLITGGAGYIGSTIASALEDAGHVPVILDSLICGRREFCEGRIFYQGDIADSDLIERIFAEHPDITHTIHCAALIIVPESVANPYEYYKTNVAKSLELFRTLARLGHPNVVFSSSASIYDKVPGFMVTEDAPMRPSSPYARTKYMMEMVLEDMSRAYGLKAVALRYFNPIGADPKMRSGAYAKNATHVLAKMMAVANGREDKFFITGTDWPTRDGSGIRDYLHVWDLAQAHVLAVTRFDNIFADCPECTYRAINLGTGNGVTVFELVKAFEEVTGKELRKDVAPARQGDVAGAYANADLAYRLLGWKTELSVAQAIADAMAWEAHKGKVLHD